MSDPDLVAGFLAFIAAGLYAYYSLALFILVRGSEPIPPWARQVLMPGREPATGALRILSIVFVASMTTVSILLVLAGLLGRGVDPTTTTRIIFLVAAALMIAWTVFLWSKYQSIGSAR